MTRYIAFLRAINVGGHIVKMDALKREFEALGFSNVATFIASGNVIFDTQARSEPAAVAKIEKRLRASLGYEVKTFLRTPEELGAIAGAKPFSAEAMAAADASLFVGFLAESPPAAIATQVVALATSADSLHISGREIYWLARRGFADSTISAAAVEKALKAPVTMRNMNTVRKLAAKTSR